MREVDREPFDGAIPAIAARRLNPSLLSGRFWVCSSFIICRRFDDPEKSVGPAHVGLDLRFDHAFRGQLSQGVQVRLVRSVRFLPPQISCWVWAKTLFPNTAAADLDVVTKEGDFAVPAMGVDAFLIA